MAPDVISREEARAKGLTFFFTGNPCRRGHICERYVKAYTCLECSKLPQRKAAIRAYDVEHAAERRAYIAQWRQNNIDRRNQLSALWAKLNPEKHALISRRRRARLRSALGSHSVEEIKVLLRRQKHRCASCLDRIGPKYEVDHIVPLVRGGSDDIGNIQILCVPCNRRKNAKDPFVWAHENGRLL